MAGKVTRTGQKEFIFTMGGRYGAISGHVGCFASGGALVRAIWCSWDFE